LARLSLKDGTGIVSIMSAKCFRFVSIIGRFYPEISGTIKLDEGGVKKYVSALYIIKKGLS
jgi:hypothetical protein